MSHNIIIELKAFPRTKPSDKINKFFPEKKIVVWVVVAVELWNSQYLL